MAKEPSLLQENLRVKQANMSVWHSLSLGPAWSKDIFR